MSPTGRVKQTGGRVRIAWIVLLVGVVLLAAALTAPGPLLAANDRIEYQRATAAFHRAARTQETKPVVWRGIAGRFQAIYRKVPKSRRGAFALYSAALSYKEAWRSRKDWKDLSRTVSRFRRFAEVFSRNPLADDALMHLAELLATGYNDAGGGVEGLPAGFETPSQGGSGAGCAETDGRPQRRARLPRPPFQKRRRQGQVFPHRSIPGTGGPSGQGKTRQNDGHGQ